MQKSTFLTNIVSGISKRLSRFTYNPYKDIGIPLLKLKILKHQTLGTLRNQKILGNKLYFYSPQEFLHGIKEIFVDKVYLISLPENPYIIDCGANIGLSILYFKKLYPNAEILAFEPDERNFSLLERNLHSFNLSNIILRQEAVWNENTYISFSEEASMSSKIDLSDSGTKKVKAIRLREHLNRKVDFLKIDIEGAEYEVLCDIADLLPNVNNMFIEYHGTYSQQNELTNLFSIISGNNFKYYIKEALSVYNHPFVLEKDKGMKYDIQLNIFCHKDFIT